VGGVPRGRIVEIYGPESSGKTTLALTIIANAPEVGRKRVFIDAEHALDAAYAQKLGVDIAELHVAQPDTVRRRSRSPTTWCARARWDVVVIDSVAALVPRAEIEGEMGDSHVGLQARLMSQALRKLTGSISKSKTCVIFINQIRMPDRRNVRLARKRRPAGGRSSSTLPLRLDIRRIATLRRARRRSATARASRWSKNKVAAPFARPSSNPLKNEGIRAKASCSTSRSRRPVVQKERHLDVVRRRAIGQGRENARLFLKEHPDVAGKKIEAKVLPALGSRSKRGAGGAGAADGPAAATTAVTQPGAPRAPAARPQPALVTARRGR